MQREEVSPHVRHALLDKTRENVDLVEAPQEEKHGTAKCKTHMPWW